MKEISRIFDLLYHQLENHPLEKALVTKQNGNWQSLSTQAYSDQVNQLSRGLLKLGVQRNDKIAVITSMNCSAWNILDMAVLQIGAQNVPIYPTSSIEAYQYILQHSEATHVFVSDENVFEKVQHAQQLGNLDLEIYSFSPLNTCRHWTEIFKLGKDITLQKQVNSLKARISPEDLATLIYTSGTTGTPKGVMLTHKNITQNVLNSASRVPFGVGTETALSFLPVCHVFERMLIYLFQYYSVSIYYAESFDALSENLKEVRPTFTTAVPRVLEKIYDALLAQGASLTGLKRRIFYWALGVGKRYEPFTSQSLGYQIQLYIARRLVLSKWKAGVGNRLELIVSGSAPLSADLARIYAAAGMLVIEGYGLTETAPVVAVNTRRKEDFKIGTVGKPIDHVSVKIADDGEILVKGANVMKGYFKDDAKTKEAFNKEGYFHTGDIGKLDAEGFLTITDRKKQLFKTSGGKYVSPQQLESRIGQSQFIEQLIVIGEGEKMPAALIQLNTEYVLKWAAYKKIELKDHSLKSLASTPVIIERIQEEIDTYNKEFGRWEQVKTFRLTPREWTIKDGLLTPTLKVRRKNVIKAFNELYHSIYQH